MSLEKEISAIKTTQNTTRIALEKNTHMSGSDIEVLCDEAESSDSNSIEVLVSGEQSICDNSFRKAQQQGYFDVNAHGHKPTPRSDIDTMETEQLKNVTEEFSTACNVGGEFKEISSDNEDEDNDDITIDESSSDPSSPSQISPNHKYINIEVNTSETQESNDKDTFSAERPGSLSLPKPLQHYEKYRGADTLSDSSDVSRSSSTAALIEEASRTPLNKQGIVIKEGDMIAFVADGLNDMIKMSSPLSVASSSVSENLQSPGGKSVSSVSSSTSAWSEATSSASEWSRDYSRMSRSPSILTASPDDIPSVDPRAVMDLEIYASKVATSVQHMVGVLKNNLFKMSALSYHCLDAHKDGVDNTCDSVDSSIKSMYALMAKCEELSKSVQPVYGIHAQIKEIERLLDLFESQVSKDEK